MQTLFKINIVALIIGIFNMPYGYYFILKTLVSLSFAKCVFDKHDLHIPFNGFMYFIIGLIILYNPIFPIPLGKFIWTIVNIVTIIVFIYLIQMEDC